VRDYLDRLEWDGVSRLETFFGVYFRAEQTGYGAAIGRMFLIAMVARIYEPGCKADYMVILEGDQGLRKSTACRVLAGDAWFSDSLPDIGNKDSMQHLRGKWLIEVAELAAMSKAETRDLKMFVTRQVEKYRPPYGRREAIEPRQCLFVGTTNDDRYLKDETGARRFWPMKVGEPEIESLTRDRDQLFAEAVHRYRADEQWWPNADFERAIIKPEQDARFDHDVWEEVIRPSLENRERVTVQEIATHIIGLPVAQIKRSEQNRIISILGRLRWTMRRSGTGRYYYPPKLKQ
jgi:predicted P-loop ATPase